MNKVHAAHRVACQIAVMPGGHRGDMVPSGGRADVLAADRHREIADLIAYALDRAAFRVVVAHDGDSARSLLAAHRPPVLVVDTVGMDVLARVTTASTDVAIIVVSALDSPESQDGGAQAGRSALPDQAVQPS
jgi:PleD family two-component response regulator